MSVKLVKAGLIPEIESAIFYFAPAVQTHFRKKK